MAVGVGVGAEEVMFKLADVLGAERGGGSKGVTFNGKSQSHKMRE